MLYVIKRDGTSVPFNEKKIEEAINKAMIEVDGELFETDTSSDIAKEIREMFSDCDEVYIEDIQDLVECKLLQSTRNDVAEAYIRYRDERTKARNLNSELMKAYARKLSGKYNEKQNANVDEVSFGGRMGEANSVVAKQIGLETCMSEMARKNHEENMIYQHDLDSYAVGMHNCLSIPFDHLLANGFNTRQTDVRPAGSVNTAMQLVAVIFQLQSLQQFGGVAATHLDWTMIPYVRKSYYKHYKDGLKYICKLSDEEIERETYLTVDPGEVPIFDDYAYSYMEAEEYALDMTEREIHQAVEGLYHNLNTLQSRSGNQLPFTSLNYGTCTFTEGRMITKALLEVSIEGIGSKRKTSIFPCGIFQVGEGINKRPGDPNYDLFQLALKSTAQRLYPNYANIDWSNAAGYDPTDPRTYFSTMGCRTANLMDVNGLGQLKDGRGNICPVTIIMPTLAMMAKENLVSTYALTDQDAKDGFSIAYFMVLLEQKINEAKDMLLERFEHICSQPAESAKFMYENGLMAGYVPEEGIRSALKHGTLAIGNLGLAETLQILVGCDHTEEKGMELAKKIYQLFKDKCTEFKEEYSLNFGVYMTPAENLCFTAMKKFKNKYGVIPNVSDKDFFTNSMHVPVWKEMSPFRKIQIESELTGYSSAGCITYVELGSTAKNNINALETLVVYAMDHDIPYFAINVPNDTCLECGYTDEFNDSCPVCGSHHIQQLRRVTGYLTGDYKSAFNEGKQQETEMRVKHI